MILYLMAFLLWSLWCFNKPPWDRVTWMTCLSGLVLGLLAFYFTLFNLTLWQMYDKHPLMPYPLQCQECHHPTGPPWLMSGSPASRVNFWSEKTCNVGWDRYLITNGSTLSNFLRLHFKLAENLLFWNWNISLISISAWANTMCRTCGWGLVTTTSRTTTARPWWSTSRESSGTRASPPALWWVKSSQLKDRRRRKFP